MDKLKPGDRVKIRKQNGLSQSCCNLVQDGICRGCPLAKGETFTVEDYVYSDHVELSSSKYDRLPCGSLVDCTWEDTNLEKAYKWIKMKG